MNKRKVDARIAYVLSIALLTSLYFVIDLNSRLNKAINEIVIIKSEEGLIIDKSDNIYKNMHQNGEEFKKNSFAENKNISSFENSSSEEFQNEKEAICENNNKFLLLSPKIDLDRLGQKYGNDKEKILKNSNKKLSVQEKKEQFLELVLPAIKESRSKLLATYRNLLDMKDSNLTSIQDEEYLKRLYSLYKIRTGDIDSLLLAVKPHPISVILAQAALESGWGTSRFFREGNNIFGIWSFDDDDDRIKAKSSQDVYLKKYDSLVEAVDDYMAILGRTPRYEDFRKTRFNSEDAYELIKHLDLYSELREEYVNRLRLVIRANDFAKFDKDEVFEDE
jgi:Bax protein